uniref:RanBP2-type domain-containing protein n=1 Tax=Desulfobacca acetoxidans TaxID=60893 RepID=A0A7C5EQX5_9BACT
MGLWLKCPACQTANPLDAKACTACNASLMNLPLSQRVYILGKEMPAAKPGAAKVTEAPKPTAAAPAAEIPQVPVEVLASTAPPAKRPKGPKGAAKKK